MGHGPPRATVAPPAGVCSSAPIPRGRVGAHRVTAAAASARLADAVAALRRGEVIGLPTETVYGLAADASNAAAVRKIFALKGRPADHPLIVHLASTAQLSSWARDIPDGARALAAAFWPGPLTLILPRQPMVLDAVTGGQDTVGLRCPAHPLARQLLDAFDGGVAAPSANRFGRISPTKASHVRDEFGDAVPIVLDGGDCEVGIESTIVAFVGSTPRILRPGRITQAQIEAVIGPVLLGSGQDSPRASGTLEAHYAPRTPMLLLSRAALEAEASQQAALGKHVRALVLGALPAGTRGQVLPADAHAYAHGLYAAMRALDNDGSHLLLVEQPPQGGDWLAVHDRLRRAAAGAEPGDDSP
ncbi:L-threonylcarbamoyladenylate synthase [soil metagenome]